MLIRWAVVAGVVALLRAGCLVEDPTEPPGDLAQLPEDTGRRVVRLVTADCAEGSKDAFVDDGCS